MSIPIPSADSLTQIKDTLIRDLDALKAKNIQPKLVAVGATDDPSVLSYERSKEKNAGTLGIAYEFINLPADTSQTALEDKLKSLAADKTVHGICLSLPLAKGLDSESALALIPQNKDVDGLNAQNLGLIACGSEDQAILAATPQSCIILAETVTPLKGKNVCVVGRGRTVGKILAQLLINRDATVTVCHSRTANTKDHTKAADIVFCAIGRGKMLTKDYFRDGQIIVDAGINYIDDKLCGDVDAESLADMNVQLTPVPGGVGKLTTILIFQNLVKCIGLQP